MLTSDVQPSPNQHFNVRRKQLSAALRFVQLPAQGPSDRSTGTRLSMSMSNSSAIFLD